MADAPVLVTISLPSEVAEVKAELDDILIENA
jgi:hypothetical protein